MKFCATIAQFIICAHIYLVYLFRQTYLYEDDVTLEENVVKLVGQKLRWATKYETLFYVYSFS